MEEKQFLGKKTNTYNLREDDSEGKNENININFKDLMKL